MFSFLKRLTLLKKVNSIRIIMLSFLLIFSNLCFSDTKNDEEKQQEISRQEKIDNLKQPLYTPFVERYVLDELKQLRIDLAAQKVVLMQQILDREHSSVDRGVNYATSTITYFFYLIAGATSILVVVGWTSIREIKERVHSLADQEIEKLVSEYEQRLGRIEHQLMQKTMHIEENREEIELTQEVQSLWLKAQQENSIKNKISIYDQILQLRTEDCEALTYKADAVLELGEPQWATALCLQALELDPENSHAFYQLACAYSLLGQIDDAILYLRKALKRSDSYQKNLLNDPLLQPLASDERFQTLLNDYDIQDN